MTAEPDRSADAERASRPPTRWAWLQVPTLYALAVAQPLFDLIGGAPEFLVAHGLRPLEVWTLVAIVAFLPAAAWSLIERALGRWIAPIAAAVWRGAGLAALWAALLLQLLDRFGLPLGGVALALVASAGGLALAWAASRPGFLRQMLTVLAPSLIIVPLIFAIRPRMAPLLLPQTVDGAAAVGRVEAGLPVVLVVFDELPLLSLLDRDRQINSRRFPAFGRLAADAVFFPDATTVAPNTTYAVPAILTGRYPDAERIATASDYPDNLFVWLGGGTPLNVVESITQMCPEDLCASLDEGAATRLRASLADLGVLYLHLLLPADLAAGLPAVSATWRDFGAAGQVAAAGDPASGGATDPRAPAEGPQARLPRHDVPGRFAAFLEGLERARDPALHYLHLNVPHVPWKFLPSGRWYGPVSAKELPFGLGGEGWRDDEWATRQALQRHLLQVGYADRLLGRLLDRLEALGLYDRCLLIVTSDHGASFWPGDSRRLPKRHRADTMRVPLLVKAPAQRTAAVDRRNAETIDIVPTITDVLGVDPPFVTEGSSLLGPPPERPLKRFLVFGTPHDGEERQDLRADGSEPSLDVDPTLERILAIFGDGGDWRAVFEIGPHPKLLGTPITGAAPASLGPTAPTVELVEPWSYEQVDPTGSFIPAQVMGTIDFGDAPPRPMALAVAIDGVVRATTHLGHGRYEGYRFSAMVPEDVFRAGANRVEVLEILAADPASPAPPALRRLRQRGEAGFRLARAPGAASTAEPQRIVADDGKTLLVRPEAITGRVLRDGSTFWGRAESASGRRIRYLLVFAGDRGLVSVRVDPGGFFDFLLPEAALAQAAGEELTIYAYHGGVASRLPIEPAGYTPSR